MLRNLKFPISILKYKLQKFKGDKKLSIILDDYEKNFAKELKKKGYCIIENFYTKLECSELTKIIDEKLSDTSMNIKEDEAKSDQRIFFSEKFSKRNFILSNTGSNNNNFIGTKSQCSRYVYI